MKHWQPAEPFSAIALDCDGTLSHIEGIDELALSNGVDDKVKALTAQAMGTTGITPELYRERINCVRPTQQQVLALGQQYYQQRSEDVVAVIATLQRLGKALYVLSAGVNPAVADFAAMLGIPKTQVFAVDLQFAANGNYNNYDSHSPLTYSSGKRQVILRLKNSHARMLMMGDGMNDIEARDAVERFVGYGGAYYRANIAALCQYYITSTSIAPLLPLVLTAAEVECLLPAEQVLYAKGLQIIENRGVIFK